MSKISLETLKILLTQKELKNVKAGSDHPRGYYICKAGGGELYKINHDGSGSVCEAEGIEWCCCWNIIGNAVCGCDCTY